ncbi:hypothetical protein PS15m_009320 [Mucor circinelloides]
MTYTNELFAMDDFLMTDSPAISTSPNPQPLLAAGGVYVDRATRAIGLDSNHDLANNLFPLIDDQFSSITSHSTATVEQFSILNTWQEDSFLAVASRTQDFDQVFFEQDFILQSSTATATQTQPIPMTSTPDLSSVYTNSYSPSIHMPLHFDNGHINGLGASLFLQHYREELPPLSYEAQQQDVLMVSPLSQFDLMPSPANSYSIMEEQSFCRAAPPIRSSNSSSGNDDGSFYTTTVIAINTSTYTTNAHGKPRYDCSKCDQNFGRPQEVSRHHLSCHSGTKMFRCDCCDKAFARKDALKRHEKSKKGDRQKRKTQRQGKSFSANKRLSL